MMSSIAKKRVIAVLIGLVLLLGVFDSVGFAQRRHRRRHHSRTKGALVGGAIGGIGGAIIGGRKGALIGAGAGAGTGYMIQRHRNKRHRRHY